MRQLAPSTEMRWTTRSVIFGLLAIGLYGFSLFSAYQLNGKLEEAKEKYADCIASHPVKSVFIFQSGRLKSRVKTDFQEYVNTNFNGMLFYRVVDNSIDEHTDRTIAKSFIFPLPFNRDIEVTPTQEFWERLVKSGFALEAGVVLLPTKVQPEQISCLGDILAHGGSVRKIPKPKKK